MSISDKQDDSNEAGKLLKHLTEGLHHWKKRWLFHLLHYFIASYALPYILRKWCILDKLKLAGSYDLDNYLACQSREILQGWS